VSAARNHLAAIAAAPRPAGGDAERKAREYCAAVLRAIGCEVVEQPFEYSTFPGKWGTPIAGVCTAVLFLASGHFGARGNPRTALGVLVAGAAILGIFAWWLGRWGVLDLPFARATSSNLVATRGAPLLWLVAHLDSKSQPIPIGVRASAIIASIVFWVAATALAIAQLLGVAATWLWIPMTVIGVLAAIPVTASVVGVRSPGALDNASGVATVLRAAELIPSRLGVGILLTSAEELGLAGARAWARTAERALAFNVDGIDDVGDIRTIYSGALPNELLMSLPRDSGWPTPERIPPGLLLDGVALADAGWHVLTVSKGSWRTVTRIHTPRDDVRHLNGTGIEEVAVLLARSIVAQTRVRGENAV
jgi:Peptidase family M28